MLITNTFLIDDKFDFMCDEYSNALVASWLGQDYDMMFAESLLVNWDDEEDFLLERVIDDDWNMYECLERYHGIKVGDQTGISRLKSTGGIIAFIRQEIARNYPVWICFNMKEVACFSEVDRRWESGMNVAIIVGIDGERADQEQFVYFRPIHFHDKYTQILSMSLEEAQASIVSVRKYEHTTVFMSHKPTNLDLGNFLRKVAEQFEDRKIHNKLERFTNHFIKAVDYESIFHRVEQRGLKHLPLIYNLSVLYRSRVLFSFCLSYLAVLKGSSVVQDFADEMAVNGGRFYTIRGMILKIFFYKELSINDNERIIGYLNKVIAAEKDLMERLKRFEGQGKPSLINPICNSMGEEEPIYHAELTPYFNNKALSDVLSKDSSANFDGIGGYFLGEQYPYGKMIISGRMSFLIADKESANDNISCREQAIAVKPGNYGSLMILASSCHGSFKDYLTLVYENQESEQLLMVSSSFWYPKAHFSEATAWQGRYAMLINDDYYIEQRKLSIYAKEYPLDRSGKLVEIILPDCPDIHVFALSLQ
ncbi:MAG: hypothetical protein LBV33_02955 [Lachnospiraceae bacterium]|jgi:hypothetical protein|nr:hypothetical protein [Lachnospiraceae bacterium]